MSNTIDPQGQQFLAALNYLQQRAARAEQQITSGRRVSSAEDAPQDLSQILGIDSHLHESQQILSNLGRVKTDVAVGEGSLQTAVQLLDQATTIGTQGGSDLGFASQQRPVLAAQIQRLHEQLVAISQTQVEGRFIFSGDADSGPAYQLNLASTDGNGVDRLSTAQATRQVQGPDGTSFSVAKTAGEIFDHRNPDDSVANDNVFAALNSLRVALQANDTAAITAALAKLQASADYLNQKLASYGNAQNLVAAAIDSTNKLQTRWTVRLSELRDTDQTAAILELNQAHAGAQAALSAEGQRPRTSLFDFLR